jgi:thiol:disulfide interchange protein DsbA
MTPTLGQGGQLPYREVRKQDGDTSRVLAFFSFSCPACRGLHVSLSRWGKTLPGGVAFAFVPAVLPERPAIAAARGWYAAQAAGASMEAFADSVYALHQERGMALDNPDLWRRAAQASGARGFEEAWRSVGERDIEMAGRKLAAYDIQATPSLAIGGRFVITPDDTQGDVPLFFRLANGLVSKVVAR